MKYMATAKTDMRAGDPVCWSGEPHRSGVAKAETGYVVVGHAEEAIDNGMVAELTRGPSGLYVLKRATPEQA